MALLKNARLFVVALLGLFISSNAFASANDGEKKDGEKKKKVTQTWVYQPNDNSRIMDPTAYSLASGPENCPTEETTIPCEVEFEATNQQQLQNELQQLGENGVLSAAISYKED